MDFTTIMIQDNYVSLMCTYQNPICAYLHYSNDFGNNSATNSNGSLARKKLPKKENEGKNDRKSLLDTNDRKSIVKLVKHYLQRKKVIVPM